jgi:hypothetical protein
MTITFYEFFFISHYPLLRPTFSSSSVCIQFLGKDLQLTQFSGFIFLATTGLV